MECDIEVVHVLNVPAVTGELDTLLLIIHLILHVVCNIYLQYMEHGVDITTKLTIIYSNKQIIHVQYILCKYMCMYKMHLII